MKKISVDDKEYKKAEKGYELSISLMQYHTQLLWQEFGVFLITQTIIIGFISSLLSNEVSNKNWINYLAIFGLLICIPWYSTFLHNYQYYLLRIEQAKKYEKTLGLDLILEGKKLYSNDGIMIGNQKLRQSLFTKIFAPKDVFPLLILGFALAFLIIFLNF